MDIMMIKQQLAQCRAELDPVFPPSTTSHIITRIMQRPEIVGLKIGIEDLPTLSSHHAPHSNDHDNVIPILYSPFVGWDESPHPHLDFFPDPGDGYNEDDNNNNTDINSCEALYDHLDHFVEELFLPPSTFTPQQQEQRRRQQQQQPTSLFGRLYNFTQAVGGIIAEFESLNPNSSHQQQQMQQLTPLTFALPTDLSAFSLSTLFNPDDTSSPSSPSSPSSQSSPSQSTKTGSPPHAITFQTFFPPSTHTTPTNLLLSHFIILSCLDHVLELPENPHYSQNHHNMTTLLSTLLFTSGHPIFASRLLTSSLMHLVHPPTLSLLTTKIFNTLFTLLPSYLENFGQGTSTQPHDDQNDVTTNTTISTSTTTNPTQKLIPHIVNMHYTHALFHHHQFHLGINNNNNNNNNNNLDMNSPSPLSLNSLGHNHLNNTLTTAKLKSRYANLSQQWYPLQFDYLHHASTLASTPPSPSPSADAHKINNSLLSYTPKAARRRMEFANQYLHALSSKLSQPLLTLPPSTLYVLLSDLQSLSTPSPTLFKSQPPGFFHNLKRQGTLSTLSQSEPMYMANLIDYALMLPSQAPLTPLPGMISQLAAFHPTRAIIAHNHLMNSFRINTSPTSRQTFKYGQYQNVWLPFTIRSLEHLCLDTNPTTHVTTSTHVNISQFLAHIKIALQSYVGGSTRTSQFDNYSTLAPSHFPPFQMNRDLHHILSSPSTTTNNPHSTPLNQLDPDTLIDLLNPTGPMPPLSPPPPPPPPAFRSGQPPFDLIINEQINNITTGEGYVNIPEMIRSKPRYQHALGSFNGRLLYDIISALQHSWGRQQQQQQQQQQQPHNNQEPSLQPTPKQNMFTVLPLAQIINALSSLKIDLPTDLELFNQLNRLGLIHAPAHFRYQPHLTLPLPFKNLDNFPFGLGNNNISLSQHAQQQQQQQQQEKHHQQKQRQPPILDFYTLKPSQSLQLLNHLSTIKKRHQLNQPPHPHSNSLTHHSDNVMMERFTITPDDIKSLTHITLPAFCENELDTTVNVNNNDNHTLMVQYRQEYQRVAQMLQHLTNQNISLSSIIPPRPIQQVIQTSTPFPFELQPPSSSSLSASSSSSPLRTRSPHLREGKETVEVINPTAQTLLVSTPADVEIALQHLQPFLRLLKPNINPFAILSALPSHFLTQPHHPTQTNHNGDQVLFGFHQMVIDEISSYLQLDPLRDFSHGSSPSSSDHHQLQDFKPLSCFRNERLLEASGHYHKGKGMSSNTYFPRLSVSRLPYLCNTVGGNPLMNTEGGGSKTIQDNLEILDSMLTLLHPNQNGCGFDNSHDNNNTTTNNNLALLQKLHPVSCVVDFVDQAPIFSVLQAAQSLIHPQFTSASTSPTLNDYDLYNAYQNTIHYNSITHEQQQQQQLQLDHFTPRILSLHLALTPSVNNSTSSVLLPPAGNALDELTLLIDLTTSHSTLPQHIDLLLSTLFATQGIIKLTSPQLTNNTITTLMGLRQRYPTAHCFHMIENFISPTHLGHHIAMNQTLIDLSFAPLNHSDELTSDLHMTRSKLLSSQLGQYLTEFTTHATGLHSDAAKEHKIIINLPSPPTTGTLSASSNSEFEAMRVGDRDQDFLPMALASIYTQTPPESRSMARNQLRQIMKSKSNYSLLDRALALERNDNLYLYPHPIHHSIVQRFTAGSFPLDFSETIYHNLTSPRREHPNWLQTPLRTAPLERHRHTQQQTAKIVHNLIQFGHPLSQPHNNNNNNNNNNMENKTARKFNHPSTFLLALRDSHRLTIRRRGAKHPKPQQSHPPNNKTRK